MLPILIPGWLLGLLGAGAAVAIVANWDKIVDWVTEFFRKFKAWFAEHFPRLYHYAKVFINKIKDFYAWIKCKSYYQDEKEDWYVNEGAKKIDASEVPADIRAQAKRTKAAELDITERVLEH